MEHRQTNKLISFNSELITVAVSTVTHHSKVFQIGFQKRDGSLFVSFPYYRNAFGLLCHATLRAGDTYPRDLSLTQSGGKFTSHKVKYSHHPDGNAHFSQDGKIFTSVRRESVPLDSAEGHLFTIHIQGLADYARVSSEDMQRLPTARKTRMDIKIVGDPPEAIKFVAHCYKESQLAVNASGTQPWILLTLQDGREHIGAIIKNPFLESREPRYLLLFFEGTPLLDKERTSALVFLGGFDPPSIALDQKKDSGFLTLSYPTDSYERLVQTLGSLDYHPASSPSTGRLV
jgi:hypothetical protein